MSAFCAQYIESIDFLLWIENFNRLSLNGIIQVRSQLTAQLLQLGSMLIIDCLKANYGIEVALLTFLPLRADMNAFVYKAHNQQEYPL